MKTIYILMFLLIASFKSACVSTKVKKGEAKTSHAHFGVNPQPLWEQKSFRGADIYFEHEGKKATIFINAECENVSDSPLEALMAQMIIGLSHIKIEKEERLMISEREALVTQMTASIDGVPRLIKIMVLRKNACVFDAVFNAPLENRELILDFDQMILSLWAEADL